MTDCDPADNAALVQALVRAVPSARSVYRDRLRLQLAAAAASRSRPAWVFQWRFGGLAAVAAVLGLLVGTSLLLSTRGATPANAYTILRGVARNVASFPYTGSSSVRYLASPQDGVPPVAGLSSEQHQASVDWSVRDPLHFRVDIRVIRPALDSGLKTIIVNGSRILSYDHRSGQAWTATIPRQGLPWARAHLLTILQSAASEGSVVEADPAQTVQAFLTRTQHDKSQFGGFARLGGKATVLSRVANVIDFGPTVITSCSHPYGQPNSATGQVTCLGGHGVGSARVWVDDSHPFILRYEEQGLSTSSSLRADFRYQVTSLAFGQGPTDATLEYRPPVTPVDTGNAWRVYPDAGQTVAGAALPARFVSPVCPGTLAAGTWCHEARSTTYDDGPLSKPTKADTLYVEGWASTESAPPASVTPGPNGAVAYVLIQERVQMHGLPAALQVGADQREAGCQAWSWTRSGGRRELAFARGDISVLVSTNALSSSQLIRYAAAMCVP